MTNEDKIELKRVNINLPVDLTERVRVYSKKLGLNITSAYIVLLNQALNQQDTVSQLPMIMSLVEEMKKMTSQNDLSLLTTQDTEIKKIDK